MGLTKAQRYNRKLHSIFDDYKTRRAKEEKMSYKQLIAAGYGKETAKFIVAQRK